MCNLWLRRMYFSSICCCTISFGRLSQLLTIITNVSSKVLILKQYKINKISLTIQFYRISTPAQYNSINVNACSSIVDYDILDVDKTWFPKSSKYLSTYLLYHSIFNIVLFLSSFRNHTIGISNPKYFSTASPKQRKNPPIYLSTPAFDTSSICVT